MNGALNLNFDKLTIPGKLTLIYILNIILLNPSVKV
jgi:hypothetical protein